MGTWTDVAEIKLYSNIYPSYIQYSVAWVYIYYPRLGDYFLVKYQYQVVFCNDTDNER